MGKMIYFFHYSIKNEKFIPEEKEVVKPLFFLATPIFFQGDEEAFAGCPDPGTGPPRSPP